MTSSNGHIFCVTGPLWGESTGHRWIPLTKANDAELWCCLWSAPEQTVEQTIETPVIWDAIVLALTSMGKFDWGISFVIIFLWVQFCVRLAVASYRVKKVRTVASPVVRWANKSRDTHNCMRNEPQYAICVVFTTRLYYKVRKVDFLGSDLQLQSYSLDGGHCDRAGHRKVTVLGMAGDQGDNPWKFLNRVTVKGTKIVLCPVKLIGNEKEWWVSHYGIV